MYYFINQLIKKIPKGVNTIVERVLITKTLLIKIFNTILKASLLDIVQLIRLTLLDTAILTLMHRFPSDHRS